mgnify:FL=1
MEGKLDIPKFDMIEGTEAGSTYLVFATANDLKLAVKPLVYARRTSSKRPAFLTLAFRLRAVPTSPDGIPSEAASTFNLPLKAKGGHASCNGGLEIVALPVRPTDARKLWHEGNMTLKLVENIRAKIAKNEAVKFVVTEEQMLDFMNLYYDGCFGEAEGEETAPIPEVQFYD